MTGFDAFKDAPKPEDQKGDDQGNSLDEFRFSKVGDVKKADEKTALNDSTAGEEYSDRLAAELTPEENFNAFKERFTSVMQKFATLPQEHKPDLGPSYLAQLVRDGSKEEVQDLYKTIEKFC